MIEIECAGERLQLLSEKAVVWLRNKSLIVCDLHFGKPAAFRKYGLAVPESTTENDLQRLDHLVSAHEVGRLIILGDFFHAADGRQASPMDSLEQWCARNQQLDLILVPGNHDKKSGAPPECWKIKSVAEGWSVPPFAFCHEPKTIAGAYVLSGHIHPAISLREKFGAGVRAPCFCFGPERAILPAFGSFTGMSTILPGRDERIFAIGASEVIEVTRA